MTPLLAARDVVLRYGAREVLAGVTLAIAPGEVVAVIGPNGAGKTSLLKVLAGIVTPEAGRVEVTGPRARSVAYLAQAEELPLHYTAREVVELGRLPYVGLWRGLDDADDRSIDRAMQRTSTAHLAERRVGALSGGERQRVALARAIAQEPRVLLLDEPTTHLDLRHQVELFATLREQASSGTAIVAVMHDLTFAAQADRCVVLADGTVRADGPPSESLAAALLERIYETAIEVLRGPEGRIAGIIAKPRA